VGQRLAEDRALHRGIDALFAGTPVNQLTSVRPKKFEKGTFYFQPEALAELDKVWLELMGKGMRCNKSEIVSILVTTGLEQYYADPANSPLLRRLTGRRRRA